MVLSLMEVSGDLAQDLVWLDVWWHFRYLVAAAWPSSAN